MLVFAGFFGDESDEFVTGMIVSVLGLYSLAGFFFARWLFLRAQDVAWSGGVIAFQDGAILRAAPNKRFPAPTSAHRGGAEKGVSTAQHQPAFCACALLVLHIGVFFLRMFYSNSHRNSVAASFRTFSGWLWLVLPLIIGGTAVAEERKLGVAGSQFCLPVSRRAQFAIKFIPAMIFGTLLGGVMPMLLETLASASRRARTNISGRRAMRAMDSPFLAFSFEISIVALAAGLSWAGFFASTLARNFLQALSFAIVTILGCILFIILLVEVMGITFFGITSVALDIAASHRHPDDSRHVAVAGLSEFQTFPRKLAFVAAQPSRSWPERCCSSS